MVVIESSYLSEISPDQQAELVILAKDQIANIFTDSPCAFGLAHTLEYCGSNKAFQILKASYKKWKMD